MRIAHAACAVFLGVLVNAPALAAPRCEGGNGYVAADLSQPIDTRFVEGLKSIGVDTIIRYYDWDPPTLPRKTLEQGELDLIAKHGLSVAIVFQHRGDRTETFEDLSRGETDARRALALARALGQPKGTAIYFGIDGVDQKFARQPARARLDYERAHGLDVIETYMRAVNDVFAGSGYKVGVYGSGLVNRVILDKGLAEYSWLANATSWPEYDDFERSGRWHIKQHLTTNDCFGKAVDLSTGNPRRRDFGQWRP